MVQQMTTMTISIYYFSIQKLCLEILAIFKVLAKTTRGPVHLEPFHPSVIRGPWVGMFKRAEPYLDKIQSEIAIKFHI